MDVAQLIQSKVKGCELKYLGQSTVDDDYDLVNDNKIQDGADKRTYRVLFDRIHNVLPGFQARWDIEKGIERLLSDLDRWMLDKTKF